MLGKSKTLQGRSVIVAALLLPFALLGQGCEKRRTEERVEPADSRAATAGSGAAPTKPSAPVPEATASSRPSVKLTHQADRPAVRSEEMREPEPVEATIVTDASFAEFTAGGVALVDFWSPRCPPCRTQGPIVEKLAKDFADRAAVGKLRVDLNREAPGRFGIMYIPTLIIFRDGEEVKRFTGLQSEATLTAALEEALRGE